MLSTVGRPREHDERTAAALLAAGERAITDGGLEALSVRGVATEAATTTRAVYSLFGSREGLIAALGAHAYDVLRGELERLP
jgi:AcrR family transcriptional regulator